MAGAKPASFKISVMLFPVMGFTSGIAYWSRSIVPIRLGGWPSLASLITSASTSSGVYRHQLGGLLLTGLVEWDLPFSFFGNSTPRTHKEHCTLIFKTSQTILLQPYAYTIQQIYAMPWLYEKTYSSLRFPSQRTFGHLLQLE